MFRDEVLRRYASRLFGHEPPGRFLDLSCGTRADIRAGVQACGWRWIGLDHQHPVGTVTGDAQALPFRDACCDVVFAAAALEHYRNPWGVVTEVFRILKLGGTLCGSIAFVQPWHGDSYYHCSPLGVRELLERAGFAVVDIHAGDVNGVGYLLRMAMPYWGVGRILAWYGDGVYALRRWAVPWAVRNVFWREKPWKDKELLRLEEDALRFAASLLFLARKPDTPQNPA